jgi:uncharacterized protein (TIGR04255 family)
MGAKLPIKLEKEPLFDAVFEIRFEAASSASNIIPGVLFGKLKGVMNIEKLPAADLPQQLRDTDPNLKFAPVVRLNWDNFIILISDRSISIACKLPYPGWDNFKKAILEILTLLKDLSIIETVQRFSLKYVDIIPSTNVEEQVSLVKLNITLGAYTLEKDNFHLRLSIPKDGLIHIVQIVSSALVTIHEKTENIEGLVLDIDTIKDIPTEDFASFINNLTDDKLDSLHLSNKEMFFDCLRDKTLIDLGAIYD